MSVAEVLRAGLAEARRSGAKQVELDHLSEDQVETLAEQTLSFLRSRPGRPSSIAGWTSVAASKAGVMPWWAEQAELSTESQRRALRTLRRQVYDLLDERGLIVKPAGQGAAIDVSPEEAEGEAESEMEEAWLLRADPQVWDLARFVADGQVGITAWAVEDNERSAAMRRGQRVFLWVGGDGVVITPGIWGVGWIAGPCQWRSADDGYWVDPAAAAQVALFADVAIELLPQPLPLAQVASDSRLLAMEVLRNPLVTNPSMLTSRETEAMITLVGFEPAHPGERT